MSGSEESEASFLEDEQIYRCKFCPNLTFTAAERDSHRRMHKETNTASRTQPRTQRPGPQSRTRPRVPSPTPTDVTLFEPIPRVPATQKRSRSPRRSAAQQRPAAQKSPSSRVRSTKKHDRDVKATSHDGG